MFLNIQKKCNLHLNLFPAHKYVKNIITKKLILGILKKISKFHVDIII